MKDIKLIEKIWGYDYIGETNVVDVFIIQFVSDASHELRTPIAVIQGYANLLDRWGKDDKEALEKSIHAIKLETGNMTNLVEKLLFLAKGDSGNQRIEKKEFLVNELINEVVRESELIDHSHIISSDKNETVCLFADYKMMKQMLRIFIIVLNLHQNEERLT
jgi:two-component system, OmpR family, sensor histidine kinase ArlS